MKSGICKTEVFLNLLDCLDLEISEDNLATISRKYSLASNGVSYMKYHSVLKALRFNNHTETWILANQEDQTLKNRIIRTTNTFNNTQRVSYEPTKGRLNAADLKKVFSSVGKSIDGANKAMTI